LDIGDGPDCIQITRCREAGLGRVRGLIPGDRITGRKERNSQTIRGGCQLIVKQIARLKRTKRETGIRIHLGVEEQLHGLFMQRHS